MIAGGYITVRCLRTLCVVSKGSNGGRRTTRRCCRGGGGIKITPDTNYSQARSTITRRRTASTTGHLYSSVPRLGSRAGQLFQSVSSTTALASNAINSTVSVRGLFPLQLVNRLTFDLDFLRVCVGHDHSSTGIQNRKVTYQSHESGLASAG